MPRLLDKLGEELRHRVSLLTTPAAKTRVIHTRVNNCDLLVRANEDVGRAIHLARNFELLETQFLKSVTGPDAVCFEIGPNCGYGANSIRPDLTLALFDAVRDAASYNIVFRAD